MTRKRTTRSLGLSLGRALGYMKRHANTGGKPFNAQFVRALKPHERSSLDKAGYPFVTVTQSDDWTELHKWLQANCVQGDRLKYTWFGGRFYFLHQADAQAFFNYLTANKETANV